MRDLFITCPHGFEPILEKELHSFGIFKTFPGFCGVFVPRTKANTFLINYQSRVATRVLWPIIEFRCEGKDDLYENCRSVNWSDILHCKKTFAIDANVNHPALTNSMFASLVVKDAICDFFREKTGARPSIDKLSPDVQLNLFIQKETATLYLDTSGDPLHKRGWRETNTEATIHESVAAALLLFTGYSAEKIFCDPFCGSGTFLVEAGLIATRTAPGFLRKKWGFFHLPNFDKSEWLTWKKEQDSLRIPLSKGLIFGSDKSRETSDICRKHIQRAGLSTSIEVGYDEIAYYSPKVPPNFILTNPPYGKRLETSLSVFEGIKKFLLEKASPDVKAYILCPEADLATAAGCSTKEELSFKNGGLPIKLLSIS